MSATLKIGQRLKGSLDTYSLTKKLQDRVWTAIGSTSQDAFVVKTAHPHPFRTEKDLLYQFQGHPCFRQLVDDIEHPPCLVLEHLDDNLLNTSNSSKLARPDLKFVARNVLTALAALHETGTVHTDVKPDNILVKFGEGPTRFSEVKLADLGDAYHVSPDADPKEDGHNIGAPIFRSPEAMLNLRWGTQTDIWSFGATLISLIWGEDWHIFKPDGISRDDDEEAYCLQVLIKQISFFGPFQLSFAEIADEERLEIVSTVINYIADNGLRKPFSMAQDKELTVEDRDFICKIMKLDPRDRPTAKELLEDKWFDLP